MSNINNEETKKYDSGKTDLSLVDNEFTNGVARVLMFGADKYQRDNWRLGTEWHRTFSALKRHIDSWWDGEDLDPETNESHLYHAACNLMFLDYWQRRGKGTDDRYNEIVTSVNDFENGDIIDSKVSDKIHVPWDNKQGGHTVGDIVHKYCDGNSRNYDNCVCWNDVTI